MKLSIFPWFDPAGWTAGIRHMFEPRRTASMSRLAEITREIRTEIEARAAHSDDYARAA